jgi:hypothetical protein
MIPLYSSGVAPTAVPSLSRRQARDVSYDVKQSLKATRFDSITSVLAWLLCVICTAVCIVSSHGVAHWYVIPVFFCGVIVAHDMIDWIRGRFDVFDPVGMFGAFGFLFFFLNPMLHVVWDLWIVEPEIRPDDLRPWMGWMACLNLVGLLIYRYLRDPLAGQVKPNRKAWIADPGRICVVLPILLVLSVFLQGLIYSGRGGLVGYMESYTRRDMAYQTESGFVAVFAESFPILAMMGYALLARRRPALASWGALTLTMLVMFVAMLYFGGLKGSRSNTLFSLFWIVGMVHFTIRPLPKKLLLVGFVIVAILGYAYTLIYKAGGLKGVQAVESGAGLDYLQRKTGRSMEATLLGDIGRADMQSFILKQICDPHFDYELSLGRTYYATLCRCIPRFIWADRPPLKAKEGTEVEFGKGTYDPITRYASYVYGATAEGMLNFGPVAVPIVFLIWTLFVARSRKWIYSLAAGDVRRLLSPFLALVCITSFMGDSDNIHFTVLKWGALPFLFLWFCSSRVPVRSLLGRLPKSNPNGAPVRQNQLGPQATV